MCCKNFWKKITVFSITFVLGFFAAGLFRNDEAIKVEFCVPIHENNLSSEDVSPTLPQSKRKNCVPADSDLKFRNLPYNESETEMSDVEFSRLFNLYVQITKLKLDVDELKKSGERKNESAQTEIKRLEDKIKLLDKPEISSQMQNLLYLERCSDYGESMKLMPTEK